MSLATKNRFLRKWPKPRIDGEFIPVPGRGRVPCEEYRIHGCRPALAAVDALPEDYRALVYEFNLPVVWQNRRRYSAAELRQKILKGEINRYG